MIQGYTSTENDSVNYHPPVNDRPVDHKKLQQRAPVS